MPASTCPFCGAGNGPGQVVDKTHRSMKKMYRPKNTRNIYQCAECGEEFLSGQTADSNHTKPVDAYFKRPGQYGQDGFLEAHNWCFEWKLNSNKGD